MRVLTTTAQTAEDTEAYGAGLAGLLRAGDLLVLSGDLGAGKTTLTRGLGAALRVRGDVTSPTFVISRVHPSTVGGPALVHVDAYRLLETDASRPLETDAIRPLETDASRPLETDAIRRGDLAELDDLDLDTSLDQAVTVVEWGTGLAESLAEDRLEVEILRAHGAEEGEARTLRLTAVGRRWQDVDLAGALAR